MERKVGEKFTYADKTYKVLTKDTCEECAFHSKEFCKANKKVTGLCCSLYREDNISVLFKEIENIKIMNNQISIKIPEGMEVDIENCNLAKNVIRLKKKDITYDAINIALDLEGSLTGIIVHKDYIYKLSAIDKLMTIAKYYNGNWKPDWKDNNSVKYYIYYSITSNCYKIGTSISYNENCVYFKKRKYAELIISNSNFKDILDTIYK